MVDRLLLETGDLLLLETGTDDLQLEQSEGSGTPRADLLPGPWSADLLPSTWRPVDLLPD